jgi:prephenate dehydrogenase
MKLADTRLVIVGLGLMGGSLAAALKGHCRRIIGVDVEARAAERAAAKGLVDGATQELGPALASCDLAILAAPVRACLDILARLGLDLPSPPRLLDIGSTKARVVDAMEKLPPEVDPIGGHPLCGRETAGLENAEGGLYRDTNFALIPLPRTSHQTRTLARELVHALGARPILLDANQHDRLVALTSQAPYLLAAALVSRAAQVAAEANELRRLTATGFHDVSRLAASDVTMMFDILVTNRDNVLAELDSLQAELGRVRSELASGDAASLRSRLKAVRQAKLALARQEV